jgi:uncharacterized membrane protein YczE
LKKEKISRLLLAAAGILMVGMGVAFNAAAGLGNDPVGMVYDGIRNAANLSSEQLGTASNIVNVILGVVVFITGRKYISIGTFLNILLYGISVDLGGGLYRLIFRVQTLPVRICGAVLGCTLLYTGVAMFITADIGLDPFSGIVMVLRDRLKKEYRYVKIGFDIGCIVLGTVLGGTLGVITIVTALTAGPVIQFAADRIGGFWDKRWKRWRTEGENIV